MELAASESEFLTQYPSYPQTLKGDQMPNVKSCLGVKQNNFRVHCLFFDVFLFWIARSLCFLTVAFLIRPVEASKIKVLSDRTESHLKPLFAEFEKQTGHKISAVFIEEGLLTRLEARPTEPDLIITKNAELLEIAKKKKWLAVISSDSIWKSIDPKFVDPDKMYFVDAYRGRAIFYSRTRIQPTQLSTYEDLKKPKWKGKICIRSGFHEYNLALFSEFVVAYGNEKAKDLIKGIHNNLARAPSGNDREQAKMIAEAKCDLALINTYYHPIMMSIPDQKPWAEATRVFFPNQKDEGVFIMRSGLAMTNGKNQKNALKLLEFLASVQGQTMMTKATYQYPTNPKVSVEPLVENLGIDQAKTWHELKMNLIPLSKMIEARGQVQKILTEMSFDTL